MDERFLYLKVFSDFLCFNAVPLLDLTNKASDIPCLAFICK
ncbi:hypothetical protein IM043_gp019 [Bacillus phage SPG24]|nr:hypothetical protein IM043_gp019 [Bacillus phage SPG24]